MKNKQNPDDYIIESYKTANSTDKKMGCPK